MLTREERIAGGLYGLLIGDALGVPYEFHPPQQLPPRAQLEFEPPPGFHRAHGSVPPGTWSDDGAHALCLLASLLYTGSDEALALDAMKQSLVTHGHLRSQVCCALYCLWARRTLEGAEDPWAEALATFHRLFPPGNEAHTELELHVRPNHPEHGRGSGYVVDCLLSARDCVRAEATYEGVVKAAVALGHDTDTTAAVAGGIAGIRDGLWTIPERWRKALRGQEFVEPLLQRLIARS